MSCSACCGDVPTLETLAAADYIRRELPEVKVRVINVVDLMKLQPPRDHPHGIADADFDELFTKDRPVVFAFHGYPTLIHKLTYKRRGHDNFHVRGFKEEGTTTTPFDMCVLNEIDRYHLVATVIDSLPALGSRVAYVKQALMRKLHQHHDYIREHGDDLPEVRDWKWPARAAQSAAAWTRRPTTNAAYGARADRAARQAPARCRFAARRAA